MAELNDATRATRFAGQFVLQPASSTPSPGLEGFNNTHLWGKYQLLTQRQAAVHTAARHAQVTVVGSVLDPWVPGLTDQDVTDKLATCTTFDELERAISRLSGRWILFVSLGGHTRLYPDAAATRAIFHARLGGAMTAASQPGLLPEPVSASAPPGLLTQLWDSPAADAWPAAVTPYPGARQLLPNHYLDLSTGRAERFWPREDVAHVDVEDAACAFADTLTGIFRAVSRRGGPINLPITGGIDSRMLLACAREIRNQLRCFTVIDTASPLHDVLVPLRLSSKLGLDFRFIVAQRAQHSDHVLRLNTGGIWRDPHEHRISAFRAPGVHAVGTVSEVCRCYYYPHGEHPASLDAAMLARLAGWGEENLAVDAFDEWLANVPRSNVPTLDLFYWECRLGNWAALDAMALDGYADSFSPFNCRALLELGLGVETRQRCAPYRLQRRVCELAAPELRGLPVNETWLGSWGNRARGSLPAGVRAGLTQFRRRMAGAPLRT